MRPRWSRNKGVRPRPPGIWPEMWKTFSQKQKDECIDEYFNVEDHWSILPSLSTVSVSKYLSDGFSFGVTGSLNKIDKFGSNVNLVTGEETTNEVDDLSYYGIDGTVK